MGAIVHFRRTRASAVTHHERTAFEVRRASSPLSVLWLGLLLTGMMTCSCFRLQFACLPHGQQEEVVSRDDVL